MFKKFWCKSIVWHTPGESNELNGCQYLDRRSHNKECRHAKGRSWVSANTLEDGTTAKLIFILPMTNEIGSRINKAKRTNMRVDSGQAQKAERAANAAPRTTSRKWAVHTPAHGAHVPGDQCPPGVLPLLPHRGLA
jgi:hypothetical protein